MVKLGTKVAQVDAAMYEIQKKGAEGGLVAASAKPDSLKWRSSNNKNTTINIK